MKVTCRCFYRWVISFLRNLVLTEEIIKQVKKNDRKIILLLYEQTFNLLMSAVVRYKNNDEDRMTIVNNSFLKIIQNIDKYQVNTAYFSWAKRIVQNEIIDDFRKNKKYQNLFDFEEDESESPEVETMEDNEDLEANELLQLLEKLPPATKLVFNLYAIDGYSNKEICDQLSISYETVKWHIKEARKKLRGLILEQKNTLV